MHKRTQCEHGTVVSNCRCMSKDKVVEIVPCPPRCKFYGKTSKGVASEITYFLAVTVVPDQDGVIQRYTDDRGDYYVKAPSGRDSLHPFDVLDVLRKELRSDDNTDRGGRLADGLWHVRSVKIHKEERVRAIDEDGGAETAGAT